MKYLAIVAVLLCTAILIVPSNAGGQRQADQQKFTVVYPTRGIKIDSRGTNYAGIIYLDVFAEGNSKPVATAQLKANQRKSFNLPLGTYEVHFGMRESSKMKTFIIRNVILRSDSPYGVTVEMNDEAETTIIGGDMTAYEMAQGIRALRAEAEDLRQENANLKKQITAMKSP